MAGRHLEKDFEHLVTELFEVHGFHVETEQLSDEATGVPDLRIRSSTGKTAVVEVKLYRSGTAPLSKLMYAARRTEASRQTLGIDSAIIVVGCKVEQKTKYTLSQQFPEMLIYDIDVIFFLTQGLSKIN